MARQDPIDDRTTRARIRDAAIACIADGGLAETTVRRIAGRAGVSPGLVMHHFGSMEALRAECDEHVAEVIRRLKRESMAEGPGLDPIASWRTAAVQGVRVSAYLAEVLTEDSPTVNRLVDELVADAEVYLEEGVATGVLRPTQDPAGRARILLLWNLGALVLHRQAERLLGVDPTDLDLEPHDLAPYARPLLDLYATGLLTEEAAASLQRAFAPDPTDDRAVS